MVSDSKNTPAKRKRRRGWIDPPPVVVLVGNFEALKRREVRKAVEAATKTGRSVSYFTGADSKSIEAQLGTVNPFFKQKRLFVVDDPAKLDGDLVERHWNADDNETVLLVVFEKGKKGKLQERLENLVKVVEYVEPKTYKMQEYLQRLCVGEARQYGKTLPPETAAILTHFISSDVEVACAEVLKLCVYADAVGDTIIDLKHIKKTVAPSRDVPMPALKDALGAADRAGISRQMAIILNLSTKDPTMGACAFLGNEVTKWLWAYHLTKSHLPPNEQAAKIGVHPFIYDRWIVPYAKFWGPIYLTRTLRVIGQVERGVMSGWIDPWTALETSLLDLAGRVRSASA